jgi:hypothetical protein
MFSPTEKNGGKEKLMLNIIDRYELLEQKREDFFIAILHEQVSYMFGDCTIIFT